jgi:hypothetical protein
MAKGMILPIIANKFETWNFKFNNLTKISSKLLNIGLSIWINTFYLIHEEKT